MPWLATGLGGAPSGEAGVLGQFWWFRPDADVTGEFNEVPLPVNVVAVDSQVSWAGYQGNAYAVGGWTDNVVFTGDFKLWSLGIEAPTVVPSVALAAGPGITAEVICYLAFYDVDTGERSPLSAASATLSAANQQITWSNLASFLPTNQRITHLQGWRSVDGSLPRLVWTRELGVSTVTEAVAAGELGEAFTEDYSKMPRCRYNAIWHERQVMAGNDEHPDTIFFSLIGFPERRSTITLRTKSGDPVVGLVVVRDTLIVLCRTASEIISGYTEDDIQIQIAQPHIGAVSHWGVQVIHGMAFIWADLGLYLCDGSSWFYLGHDIQPVYAADYQGRRADYEASWSAHDPATYASFLYVGDMVLNPTNPTSDEVGHEPIPAAAWTIDYNAVIPQQGGNFSQPNWSIDTHPEAGSMRCSAVLAVPGGRRGDAYFGNSGGRILRYDGENVLSSGEGLEFQLHIEHGADAYGDFGGDTTHGKRFCEIDVFLESEELGWRLYVLGGDERIGQLENQLDPQFIGDVFPSGDELRERVPVHNFKLASVTGRCAVVRITTMAASEISLQNFEYNGYQIYWMPGPVYRRRAAEPE